jgi:CRISPR-associated endoribonuclease Cas6
MNKYSAIDSKMDMRDEETLDQLSQNSEIVRYRLRSAPFPLEGVNITGFQGDIRIRIKGTDTMSRFAKMLFSFGEFSGVGIKTSLGMGALNLHERRENI